MNRAVAFAALCCLSSVSLAKDRPIPLAESTIPSLEGKTLVVVRHEKPSLGAMTAGKAAFGLFGGLAMIKAGKNIVENNHVADPADVVEQALASAIADRYHMTLLPTPAQVKETKPAKIARSQPEADYVLDIRSGAWMFGYFPSKWDDYWLMYQTQVWLIDVKTSNLVEAAVCGLNSKADVHRPQHDDLLANEAQLLKDLSNSLAWQCARVIGTEQFHLADNEMPETPAMYQDVLSKYAAARRGAAPGQAGTVGAGAGTETESASASDAATTATPDADTGPAAEAGSDVNANTDDAAAAAAGNDDAPASSPEATESAPVDAKQ